MKELDKDSNELFWNAKVEELINGYVEKDESYECIFCGEEFTKGRIYEINSIFFEAQKTAKIHIEKKHGSSLEYILGMNNSFTGISDVQRELLKMMAYGLSDKEIAGKLNIAKSTIRNHRFKLREKEKQARLLLAIMEMIFGKEKRKINMLEDTSLCDAHKTATTIDDRYNITTKERETVLKNYMNSDGSIKSYPAKEKKKIIILSEIIKKFSRDKQYNEKEVNEIIKLVYEDYATIRRALVEYGFIYRSDDCTNYWIK
ncbi:MAG TPA: transcriptional regulator [Clostridium sp.]|nr:transcriptional regulator [Clostridium sp.]